MALDPPEFVRIATDGLHGKVQGYQLASDGYVFEGGAVVTPSEIPTTSRAEGIFFSSSDPEALSENSLGLSVDGADQETLAGKFIVRK